MLPFTPPFSFAQSFRRALYLPFWSATVASPSSVTGVSQVDSASTTNSFCPRNFALFNLGVLTYNFLMCFPYANGYYTHTYIHVKIYHGNCPDGSTWRGLLIWLQLPLLLDSAFGNFPSDTS